MRQIDQICELASKEQGIRATFFDDAWVRERVGIKRAITGGGVPSDLVKDFQGLWQACQITANIAELDLILADYDVRSSAPRSIPIDQLNASNDD